MSKVCVCNRASGRRVSSSTELENLCSPDSPGAPDDEMLLAVASDGARLFRTPSHHRVGHARVQMSFEPDPFDRISNAAFRAPYSMRRRADTYFVERPRIMESRASRVAHPLRSAMLVFFCSIVFAFAVEPTETYEFVKRVVAAEDRARIELVKDAPVAVEKLAIAAQNGEAAAQQSLVAVEQGLVAVEQVASSTVELAGGAVQFATPLAQEFGKAAGRSLLDGLRLLIASLKSYREELLAEDRSATATVAGAGALIQEAKMAIAAIDATASAKEDKMPDRHEVMAPSESSAPEAAMSEPEPLSGEIEPPAPTQPESVAPSMETAAPAPTESIAVAKEAHAPQAAEEVATQEFVTPAQPAHRVQPAQPAQPAQPSQPSQLAQAAQPAEPPQPVSASAPSVAVAVSPPPPPAARTAAAEEAIAAMQARRSALRTKVANAAAVTRTSESELSALRGELKEALAALEAACGDAQRLR